MRRELRRRLQALAVGAVTGVLRLLPAGAARPIGRGLGSLGYFVLRRERRLALSNLGRVFPERSEAERRKIARESFRRLGWSLLELLVRPGRPKVGPFAGMEVRGLDELREARDRGTGVIVVTAHLGNWELLGAAMVRQGFPHQSVAKAPKNPRLATWVQGHRRRLGLEVVWAGPSAALELGERLEKGGIVSLVTDQDARSRGVPVRFLGQPAQAYKGAAALALLSGAELVVATIVRFAGGRRHRIEYVRVARPEPSGLFGEDVRRLTQAYTDILSERIRAHPEDYLWAHDRFKSARAVELPGGEIRP